MEEQLYVYGQIPLCKKLFKSCAENRAV